MFVAQRKDATLDKDDLQAAARTLVDPKVLVDVSRLGRSVLHVVELKSSATYIPKVKTIENANLYGVTLTFLPHDVVISPRHHGQRRCTW